MFKYKRKNKDVSKKVTQKVNLKKRYLICGLLGVVAIGGAVTHYYRSHHKTQLQTSEVVEAVPVQTAVGNSQIINSVLSGEVEANNSSKIKIDTSKGEVKEVFVHEGDTVTAGQALFSYDSSQATTAQAASYDVQEKAEAVNVARSNASVKWATYNRKVAALNQLKDNYNKTKDDSLLSDIKTAQDEVDTSLSDAQTGDNDLKTAQIEYEKAAATSQTENERLQYDTVTADTDGTVTKLNEPLKNQSKENKEKENFIEIVDRSKYFVRGEVSEMDKDKINVGQRVSVVDRKDSSKTWLGTVTQVGDLTTDSSTSSDGKENPNMSKYAYKVELDQNDNPPVIGTHTYVKLVDSSTEAGKLILNKNYLFEKDGKTYVWKVEDKKIKKQEVTVQAISANLYEVTEGLSQDDTIAPVKKGMTDGMEVGQNVNA